MQHTGRIHTKKYAADFKFGRWYYHWLFDYKISYDLLFPHNEEKYETGTMWWERALE